MNIAHQQLDGSNFTTLKGPWVNIDNALSIINANGKDFAFGERANNNSVMTAKIYSSYDDKSREVKQNDVVDRRAQIYYSNMTAEETNNFFSNLIPLSPTTPEGWNGIIVPDGGEGSYYYMLLSNFAGKQECTLKNIRNHAGKPVFTTKTIITKAGSTATFTAEENHSVVNTLKFFIEGSGITAIQDKNDPATIYLRNNMKRKNTIFVNAFDGGKVISKSLKLKKEMLKVCIHGGELIVE